MDKHIRELWDYLKDYGATNIQIQSGGKHNKVLFEYDGLQRTYLVAHSPSDNWHATQNTKAALRRMLGPPIPIEEKQPRKLEDMMNELNQTTAVKYIGAPPVTELPKTAAKTWKVWVCGYAHRGVSTQLYFHFEDNMVEELFPFGLKIERLDDEHWKLIRSTVRQRSRFSRKKGSRSTVSCLDKLTKPFGSTEAEAVEADGAILVYLPLEKRAPIAPLVPWPTQIQQPTTKPVPMPINPQQPAPLAAALTTKPPTPTPPVPASLEAQMRDIIRQIQGIEATCPYHLVRLEGGRIQWRAPVIE